MRTPKVRQDDVEDREVHNRRILQGCKVKVNKTARARHFEKGAKMDDDNNQLKTKTSPYSKVPGETKVPRPNHQNTHSNIDRCLVKILYQSVRKTSMKKSRDL